MNEHPVCVVPIWLQEMVEGWSRGKLRRKRRSAEEIVRQFWGSVDIASHDSCWVWTGLRRAQGYGSTHLCGRNYRSHRMAWALTRGEVPNGMCVLHRCDNTSCVNPEHLWLGTYADNNLDMAKKGRVRGAVVSNPDRCKNGHPRSLSRRTPSGELKCLECGKQRCREYRARRRSAPPASVCQ